MMTMVTKYRYKKDRYKKKEEEENTKTMMPQVASGKFNSNYWQ